MPTVKADKKPRTMRRVNEQPRPALALAPTTPAPTPADPPAAAPTPAAATPAADESGPRVRKLALIFNDNETAFNIERMERSTIERFRRAVKNTPGLLDNGEPSVDEESLLDVSGIIGKAYELLFGSAAAFAVRARKLSPAKAAAFVNPERIKPLIPRTEKVIDEKFGAKLRDLPPLAQLGLDVVATLGLMLQDAAETPDDAPAPGAPTHAPGQEVRHH